MPKQRKPSKTQRDVLTKMRDGWEYFWTNGVFNGQDFLSAHEVGTAYRRVSFPTRHALVKQGWIRLDGRFGGTAALTDAGREVLDAE